jgi:hypothetical protein
VVFEQDAPAKQADEEVQTEGDPWRGSTFLPTSRAASSSKKWRELIKKVWEADPLRCPKRSREMRIVSLIDEEDFHRAHPAPSRAPARGGGRAIRHRPAGQNDPRSMARRPLPDYDTEPVMAFSAT